jgi:hypothetical protein
MPLSAAANTLEVSYSGVLADGEDQTGLFGSAGSLAGKAATITFTYDLSQGTFVNTPNFSSLVEPGPSVGRDPADVLISIGGLTTISGDTNGLATDQAMAGNTNQSFSLSLPQLNNTDVVVTSASNPSIPSSILQDYTLDDIPFSVSFFLTQEGFYNVFGNLTFGDLSVVDVPTPTPLPAALPLFAAVLGAMCLVSLRGNRKAKARGA